MRSPQIGLVFVGAMLLAAGCASETTDDEPGAEGAQAASEDEKEYSFRHELPTRGLFDQPFKKSFPIQIEKNGVSVTMTITPTAKIAVSSPVIEGKVTIGQRGFLSSALGRSVPKIMDAEVKATSQYDAELNVDLDIRWNTTERKEVMREITREIETKLNGGKALELATNLGETNIPVKDAEGNVRDDVPLKGHYDVVVTCSFDEIDGDLQGAFRAGVNGSVTARAVYNSEGVERRRFRRDPTRKFELDTSDFRVDPAPSFRFTGLRQHVKGSCSVQPSVVVTFDNGVGVRLRVDARSTFDTQFRAQAGAGASWHLRATPSLALWGESDIRVPIIHTTLDTETQLFSRQFPEVAVAIP